MKNQKNKMKTSELRKLIREEVQSMLNEANLDSYSDSVLAHMKELAIKMNLGKGFNDKYWKWFSTTEDFKKMIDTAKMNRQPESRAAKSIMSIWR